MHTPFPESIPFSTQYYTREDARRAGRLIRAATGRRFKVIALGDFWLLALSAVRS